MDIVAWEPATWLKSLFSNCHGRMQNIHIYTYIGMCLCVYFLYMQAYVRQWACICVTIGLDKLTVSCTAIQKQVSPKTEDDDAPTNHCRHILRGESFVYFWGWWWGCYTNKDSVSLGEWRQCVSRMKASWIEASQLLRCEPRLKFQLITLMHSIKHLVCDQYEDLIVERGHRRRCA